MTFYHLDVSDSPTIPLGLNEYQQLSRGTAVYATQNKAYALVGRITDYLTAGALFNPEAMDHQAVRELLIECRDVLAHSAKQFGLIYSILALCGEAGELANKLKKNLRAGTEPDPNVLSDELGDVQWYVASTAHELGKTLEAVARENIEKLAKRKAESRITG